MGSAPSPAATSPRVESSVERGVVLLFVCFFLSGASGLVFEVIWTRMLMLVFGATTPAISTVLSAFMGGLALGSFVLGRYVDRLKFPVLTYAAMEAGVGIFSLLIPVVVRHLYPPIGHWITNHAGNSFGGVILLRFLVVAVVLLPPTTLMGATLPLLTKHIVRVRGGLGQKVGALYAVNTLGAVFGTFIAGFILLPGIGLSWTNAIAGLTNLSLAALIIAFRRQLLQGVMPASWRELLPSASVEPASGPIEKAVDPAPSKPPPENKKKSKKNGDAASKESAVEPVELLLDDKPREEDLIEEPVTRGTRIAVMAAACGSGFAALAYEVILTRALDMVIGSSVYSFSIILMAFLVGIGGGSVIASLILRARPGPVMAMSVGSAFLFVALLAMLIYGTLVSKLLFVMTAIVVMLAVLIASTWRRPVLALGGVQLVIGVAAAFTYYFQDKIPRMFVYLAMVATDSCDPSRPLRFSQHVGTVQAISFLVAVAVALPAAIGMGAAFPLAVRAYARDPKNIGRDTGAVYSINTIGSIAGSFLAGFVIMPAVGIETSFYFAVALNLALSLWLLLASPGDEPAKYVLVPITAILLAIAATGGVLGRDVRVQRAQSRFTVYPRPWNQELMTMGVFRLSLADGMIQRRANQCLETEQSDREAGLGGDNPIFYRDGITTTVTVERWALGDHTHYALKNNGKVDASNGDDMPTQVLVSAYPLLLHPRGPENLDVALIGWGSGVTVGTTLQFPIRHLDVIELERATVDASRYFTEVNHLHYNLHDFPYVEAPRLTIHNNDGRNYLAGTTHRYDVIISEPSNPWITGVSNLFTIDHFRAASQALAPGGIYLQWVQLYEMSPNNIKTIYRTFAEVFPYVRVFAADAYSSDTIVLGSFSPIALDVAHVRNVLENNPRIRDAIRPSHVQTATDLFARMIFSNRDELRRFSTIEEHLENGNWNVRLNANGSGPCDPRDCRRHPAAINTDDNALIEFAAPRDLIAFDAFAGYTETLYADDWPYGHVEQQLSNVGDGADRVRSLSELGVSLLAAGRPSRAGEVIDEAASIHGPDGQPLRTPALEQAVSVWSGMTRAPDPALHLESPRPGPDISREGERRLQEAYDRATQSLADGSMRTALAAFAEIPVSVREHSGPSLRMLYGYLLYQSSAAEGAEPRFGEAAEELERLANEEPEWAIHHPEVMFYVGRARYRAGDFALGVAAMSTYVNLSRTPQVREHEAFDIPRDLPEPPFDAPPVTDAPGERDKDTHRAG